VRGEDGAARGIEGLPDGPLGSVAPANSRIRSRRCQRVPSVGVRLRNGATVAWLTRRSRLSVPMAAGLREVRNRKWARKVTSSP
jgi:hypothetical protein